MKSITLTGVIYLLFASILIMGGCSSKQAKIDSDQKLQQEGTEIDQLLGVSERGETPESNPDEDEVLQLLGITKEKSEKTTTQESSKSEDQLQQEISDLEKKLADKDTEISLLRSDIAKKDERIDELESGYGKRVTTTEGRYTSFGSYGEDYQNALSEYNSRNYKVAIQMFEELLARDPANTLADNCRYWIGECYYGLGNYNQAIIEFTKVFSFNKSNKMDDAQLKLGLCHWKLGDQVKARQEFEQLISGYPNSEYVEKARQFLSKL